MTYIYDIIGYAIITETEQALWTDGRYFLQADQQLDCNWNLMRQGINVTSLSNLALV